MLHHTLPLRIDHVIRPGQCIDGTGLSVDRDGRRRVGERAERVPPSPINTKSFRTKEVRWTGDTFFPYESYGLESRKSSRREKRKGYRCTSLNRLFR